MVSESFDVFGGQQLVGDNRPRKTASDDLVEAIGRETGTWLLDGHVFTRDALLERVWDDPGESLDRTVDAHVKTLRAKMKAIAPALSRFRGSRMIREPRPATLRSSAS